MKTGQLQRHLAAETDNSAVEAFNCRDVQSYRGFSCRGIQLCRGFSCREGSVIKADQLQRCSAAETDDSVTEIFSCREGSSAVKAVQ